MRGEATKAYSSAKMKHFTHDMVFLQNFNDKYPALLVYNRVETTNPDFTKTFAAHGQSANNLGVLVDCHPL